MSPAQTATQEPPTPSSGRFFEDFRLGELITHATPRTLSDGDAALYQALYGDRNILGSSAEAARALGYRDRPLNDWLVFHTVFGKTVADISRHAVANLGYAQGRFLAPVYAGDTLSAQSEVTGLKENTSGQSGLVMVETKGSNQHGDTVLSYCRWVMVKKRDVDSPAPQAAHWQVPAGVVDAAALKAPPVDFTAWDDKAAGSARRFDDYAIGDKLHHGDGMTLEEADHMMATRSYQNTAAVHFDALLQADSRYGKRLIYGGHIISHAHAMSFNGLENAGPVLALNGGTHAAPAFAGDTIYGWSEIVEKADVPTRDDVGALRVRHYIGKNDRCTAMQARNGDSELLAHIILELDVWLAMPR